MSYLLIGLAGAMVVFAFAFHTAKRGIEWKEEHQSQLHNTDYWYGPFYVNKSDKRIFLQKKRAGGYTINFGNPVGIIITLAFLSCLAWIIYIGN